MKSLRKLFKDKAMQYRLQSEDYIQKTINQMSNLSKEKKEEIAEQIVWFVRMKEPKQLQIKFNKIAGLINDLQMQMLSNYLPTCKNCGDDLIKNICYTCNV